MKNQKELTDEEIIRHLKDPDKQDKAMRHLLFTKSGAPGFSGKVAYTVKDFVKKNGGDAHLAEDVLSEGAVAFLENIKAGKFKGESCLTTYFVGICKNKWWETWRRRRRIDFDGETEKMDSPSEDMADAQLIRAQLLDDREKRGPILRRLIGQLREACQKALILYYFESFGYGQLHEELKLKNIGQARKKVMTCRNQLKAIINENPAIRNFLKSTR